MPVRGRHAAFFISGGRFFPGHISGPELTSCDYLSAPRPHIPLPNYPPAAQRAALVSCTTACTFVCAGASVCRDGFSLGVVFRVPGGGGGPAALNMTSARGTAFCHPLSVLMEFQSPTVRRRRRPPSPAAAAEGFPFLSAASYPRPHPP